MYGGRDRRWLHGFFLLSIGLLGSQPAQAGNCFSGGRTKSCKAHGEITPAKLERMDTGELLDVRARGVQEAQTGQRRFHDLRDTGGDSIFSDTTIKSQTNRIMAHTRNIANVDKILVGKDRPVPHEDPLRRQDTPLSPNYPRHAGIPDPLNLKRKPYIRPGERASVRVPQSIASSRDFSSRDFGLDSGGHTARAASHAPSSRAKSSRSQSVRSESRRVRSPLAADSPRSEQPGSNRPHTVRPAPVAPAHSARTGRSEKSGRTTTSSKRSRREPGHRESSRRQAATTSTQRVAEPLLRVAGGDHHSPALGTTNPLHIATVGNSSHLRPQRHL